MRNEEEPAMRQSRRARCVKALAVFRRCRWERLLVSCLSAREVLGKPLTRADPALRGDERLSCVNRQSHARLKVESR